MNFGNIVGLIGAGVAGYQRGQQQRRDQDQQDADNEYRQWQRDQAKQQAARDDALRGDIAQATAPGIMQTAFGGTKPDTMDDRDVGQPGEQAVAQPSWSVNGRRFMSQGDAQSALDDYNSPGAQANRVSAAYMKAGQPIMAQAMQQRQQDAELTRLNLQQKHREMANQMWDDKLGGLASHDAIADYVSNSPADGQGGALKLKAVASKDGKTVTYNRVNDDGSLTPTGHIYSNDNAGVTKAQLWLSRNVPLETKIQNLHADDQLARQQSHDDAMLRLERQKVAMEDRHYRAMEGIATTTAATKASKAGTAYQRMDEDSKLQYRAAQEAEKVAQGRIDDGLSKGTLDPNSPAYGMLQQNLSAARLQRVRFEAKNGLIDPEDTAADLARDETDPAKIIKGVQQAYALGGKEFGDAVKRAAQPRIDALLSKAQAGGPASASTDSAPVARNVAPGTRTPTVDFSGGSSGAQRRAAALQSQLPAAQANVAAAKQALDALPPMAAMQRAAASDRLANARAALADLQTKLGAN